MRYALRNREKLLFQAVEPWPASRALGVIFQLWGASLLRISRNSIENNLRMALLLTGGKRYGHGITAVGCLDNNILRKYVRTMLAE